jgi:hypothetical protein
MIIIIIIIAQYEQWEDWNALDGKASPNAKPNFPLLHCDKKKYARTCYRVPGFILLNKPTPGIANMH